MGFISDILTDIGDAGQYAIDWYNNDGDATYETEKDRDKKWQQEMQERDNAFNLKMWKLNNEYNSPSAQMQRLKQAGLSASGAANMLSGGTSAGAITSASQPTAPDQNSTSANLNAVTNAISSLGLLKSQKDNLNADTRNKIAEADRNEKTLLYDIDLLKKQSKDFEVQWNKIEHENNLSNEQRKNLEILNNWANQKEELEIKNMIASINETNQRIEILKKQGNEMDLNQQKLEWEQTFRDNCGIDPHSNEMQMLIQAALSGKIAPVLDAFEKGVNVVFNKARELYFDSGLNNKFDELNNELNEIRNFKLRDLFTGKKPKNYPSYGRHRGISFRWDKSPTSYTW